jgi:hypothetical protein
LLTDIGFYSFRSADVSIRIPGGLQAAAARPLIKGKIEMGTALAYRLHGHMVLAVVEAKKATGASDILAKAKYAAVQGLAYCLCLTDRSVLIDVGVRSLVYQDDKIHLHVSRPTRSWFFDTFLPYLADQMASECGGASGARNNEFRNAVTLALLAFLKGATEKRLIGFRNEAFATAGECEEFIAAATAMGEADALENLLMPIQTPAAGVHVNAAARHGTNTNDSDGDSGARSGVSQADVPASRELSMQRGMCFSFWRTLLKRKGKGDSRSPALTQVPHARTSAVSGPAPVI